MVNFGDPSQIATPPSQTTSQTHPPVKVQTFQVRLPSNGQLYGGKSSIEMILFNVADVKRLYDLSRGTTSDSIQRLVGEKILDFDVKKLTKADFWYILYWLRLNTFQSTPLRLKWTCYQPRKDNEELLCERENSSEVTNDCLVIEEISSDYVEPARYTLRNGEEIYLRLPRVGDDDEVRDVLHKEHNGKETTGDEWLCRLAALIDFPHAQLSLAERYQIVRNKDRFTPDDIHAIDAFQEAFNYGPLNVVNLKCTGCQEVSQVNFRIGLEDFFPSVADREHIRNAVRFGNAPASTNNLT